MNRAHLEIGNAGTDKWNLVGSACLSVQSVTKEKALQNRANSPNAQGSVKSLLQEDCSGNV